MKSFSFQLFLTAILAIGAAAPAKATSDSETYKLPTGWRISGSPGQKDWKQCRQRGSQSEQCYQVTGAVQRDEFAPADIRGTGTAKWYCVDTYIPGSAGKGVPAKRKCNAEEIMPRSTEVESDNLYNKEQQYLRAMDRPGQPGNPADQKKELHDIIWNPGASLE